MQPPLFRVVLLMGLFGILLACDSSSPLKDLPSQLVLESYKPNGELADQRIVTANDPVFQRLKSILDAEKTGWQRSVVSYKTGPYILRAENMIIRCYTDTIIIDVMDSGRSTSMKKKLPNLLQNLGLSD